MFFEMNSRRKEETDNNKSEKEADIDAVKDGGWKVL